MYKKIEVVPYNPNWPVFFDNESQMIKAALEENCLAIHHIGSTSVPGLAAKDKVDMIVVVSDPVNVRAPLEKIGIIYRGEYNIPLHYGFSKRGDVDLNIHVYEDSHPEIELNLVFRDYLRTHPNARDAYAKFKQELLRNESAQNKTNFGFTNYTLGKGDFIRKVLKEAGFDRIRILKCNDETEWKAAKNFRNKYFFGPYGIEDPYTWTFHHSEHAHLALYKGADIIGYAHIQFWPNNRAAMRIIVVDDDKRNQSAGSQFLASIEKWVITLGIKSIHAESRKSSLSFYLKNGYSKMPFNDPEDHETDPNDVPVGKIL